VLRLTWHGASFGIVFAGAVIAALSCGDGDEVPASFGICKPPLRAGGATIALEPAFGGDLKFTDPTEIVLGPDRRFYILEQAGRVKVVPFGGGEAKVALDVSAKISSGGEAGLLGIAFDPKFAQNGFVYVYFTEKVDPKPNIVFQDMLVRYTSKDGGATLDPSTEKVLIKLDDPFTNHNGGRVVFGPDGLLYLGIGDGGDSGDPFKNSQNKDVLFGKILRIDPSAGDPYGIPPSNPFAAGGGRPEIYAYGLRNPWKFSFDTLTGDLWCADVGQNKYEEIDRIVSGGNYGWNLREGKHCFQSATCPTDGLIDPIAEYGRTDGFSVTGGYVYRGKKIPALTGKFVYGDFGSGNIWGIDPGETAGDLLTASNLKISSFGQDDEGELYAADYSTGTVSRIVPGPASPAAPADPTSALLSATGCVSPQSSAPPPGAIPYSVASPLWSDGAQKDRWLFVPQGAKIGVRSDGDFDLPPASVAVKTFSVAGKKVETRLLVHYEDGSWAGYSYEWKDDQSDAVLLTEDKTKDLGGGASWTYPSRSECLACHTAAAGFSLGLEARQLNHDGVLDRFADVLQAPVAKDQFPPLAAADTPGASSEERARGYLHANCSICHRPGAGAGAATFDLRRDRTFAETRTCNVAPQAGTLGKTDAKLIVPGDPSRSAIALRMRALDGTRMPPLATHVVDEAGAAAIETWIRELTACP
jgi:uncharacterized repeat protein (TIGR03806 family)